MLFWMALQGAVYETTSPHHVAALIFGEEAGRLGNPFGLSLHIALRKFYSVVAFALVGFLWLGALRPPLTRARRMILAVAAYSGAIEIAQYFAGSQEGLSWNAFDVLCGAVGGAVSIRMYGWYRRAGNDDARGTR